MKTLVIHPEDPTTEFLKPIYSNIENITILRKGYTKDQVRHIIEESDRIIMLGHGAPGGLFSIGQFDQCPNGFIIDDTMVAALGGKKNNAYIWCHADQFVEHHYLKGFYSGMFISENHEASLYRVYAGENDIEQSNNLFVDVVSKNILKETKDLYFLAKAGYYIHNNEVSFYNNERLNWR